MKFKKKTLAIVAAAVLSAPFGSAYADVMATAVIEFTDFKIYGSIGGVRTQLDKGDFATDSLKFNSTADADATLFGIGESFTNASNTTSSGTDFPYTPSGAVESPVGNDLCIGDCAGALIGAINNDNNFDHIAHADVVAASKTSYTWADQLETGAPITGLTYTDDSGVIISVPSSADVANSSYGYIDSFATGKGGANSDNGLNSEFTFALNKDQDYLEVEFTLDAFLSVWASADESGGLLASASTLYTLDIDGSTNWELIVAGVGTGFVVGSLTDALGISTQLPGKEKFDANLGAPSSQVWRTTRSFAAGDQNTLTARLESSVEVVRVPEPAILGFMGVGIIGFVAARRRRKQKA